MFVETDSPYLTPVPYRGKRNEPAHVRLVAEMVATVKGITLEEVAHTTTRNVQQLFGI
jgi:TatD DNase family protein